MYNQDIESARELITIHGIEIANELDGFGKTWLMWEVIKCNVEVVRLLLEYGVDKNIQDTNGKIAVDFANTKDIVNLLQ
eukprot:g13280.t1